MIISSHKSNIYTFVVKTFLDNPTPKLKITNQIFTRLSFGDHLKIILPLWLKNWNGKTIQFWREGIIFYTWVKYITSAYTNCLGQFPGACSFFSLPCFGEKLRLFRRPGSELTCIFLIGETFYQCEKMSQGNREGTAPITFTRKRTLPRTSRHIIIYLVACFELGSFIM